MFQEAVQFSNVSASQAFSLTLGGRYVAAVKASNYGTIKLQMLAGDGSTYVDIKRAFDNAGTEQDDVIGTFAANGAKVFDLPPGSYQFTISSATAAYITLARCPLA